MVVFLATPCVSAVKNLFGIEFDGFMYVKLFIYVYEQMDLVVGMYVLRYGLNCFCVWFF